jgi:hypothetical protein
VSARHRAQQLGMDGKTALNVSQGELVELMTSPCEKQAERTRRTAVPHTTVYVSIQCVIARDLLARDGGQWRRADTAG